jgi:pimeloyl-ACP methyl ester carboxylesterase
MPDIVVNGCKIRYQEMGAGTPVVLTPGGRWGGYVQEAVASLLAQHHRVITWDRRNCDGAADIVIGGGSTEAEIWADDLAGLITHLDIAPCYVGEYAGCRTTPWLALRHPGLVKGMLLAWPSGGPYPAERLPRNFYDQYIEAARSGGMEQVAATANFADSMQHNPGNRQRLLDMNADEFVATMSSWAIAFTGSADLPIAGCTATAQQWASIDLPAIVVAGCDPVHPTATAETISGLMPDCTFHGPVIPLDEWDRVFGSNPYPVTSKLQGERVAPVWLDFLANQLS